MAAHQQRAHQLQSHSTPWPADLKDLAANPFPTTFSNPIYQGADPWVTHKDGWYYLCKSGYGGQIEVWKSRSPVHRGQCAVVWTPPRRSWNSHQVWAPELHWLNGKWYIYYAASDGRNANHRMGVLECTTTDPQDAFIDRGQLYTGDDFRNHRNNRWAIDGTILNQDGRLYFLWSGWEDHRDLQHLYIARMSDPCTIAGNRSQLAPNDCHPWERVAECPHQRGLHEAPQILHRNGRIFLIYSCSGSWQHSYKLGMLHMPDYLDPMNSSNWTKHNRPVFNSTNEIYGVGHCCFTHSPDHSEDWLIYHAKRHRNDGWDRIVRAQKFGWDEDGLPDFGQPAPNNELLSMPSTTRLPMPAEGGARIIESDAMPLQV